MAVGAAGRRNVCVYWLAGKCMRNPCRFAHDEASSQQQHQQGSESWNRWVWKRDPNSATVSIPKTKSTPSQVSTSEALTTNETLPSSPTPTFTSLSAAGTYLGPNLGTHEIPAPSSGSTGSLQKTEGDDRESLKLSWKKDVCPKWVLGKCEDPNDRCRYLHSWVKGEALSMVARLEGHEKSVTGIALPEGSTRLCSTSADGTVRLWDCNSGQCVQEFKAGVEIGSIIKDAEWVFVGMPETIKAWNFQTCQEYDLKGVVGQVYAMVLGADMLFAGSENGDIFVWKRIFNNSPINHFQPFKVLKGHRGAIGSLVIGRQRLYSGSNDHTIRVWDLDSLECRETLCRHTDAVTSLLCSQRFLMSGSSNKTVKVWAMNEEGKMDVILNHEEEQGVLALCGVDDSKGTPILLCSCKDGSVCLYELPSFLEKGRLYSKGDVGVIETGPQGLLFTGDASGLITVWRWL